MDFLNDIKQVYNRVHVPTTNEIINYLQPKYEGVMDYFMPGRKKMKPQLAVPTEQNYNPPPASRLENPLGAWVNQKLGTVDRQEAELRKQGLLD